MKIDAMLSGASLHQARDYAAACERTGFDGLWFTEGGRTAYLGAGAAVLATERLTIGTGVAVAFPRSPFVTAAIAWELAEASGGRFVLGLGTQVKGHVERRYATAFDPPGPRLREYVMAVRAVWRSFQEGAPLRFEGEYWPMSIGSLGVWTPGPIEHPSVPIYLAAVRPWMLRMTGEVADGLHVHPLHSRRYLDEVVVPNVADGAALAGRSVEDVAMVCPVLTIVGDTDQERTAWRERARMQLAFYGSTRSYHGVFDVHGWHGTSDALYERQKAGDLAGMAALVTDEMLAQYAVEATWDELAGRLVERYRGVASRLIMYFSGTQWRADPDAHERWAEVCASVHAATGA